MTVVVRSAGLDPTALASPVRDLIREMDPTVAIGATQPLREIVSKSMAKTSFVSLLLAIAAGMALALGAIGLYGVMAFIVEQRRREIGIRMALGASERSVRKMVLLHAGLLAGGGAIAGLLAALAATRVLSSQLFGVEATDMLTLGSATGLLLLVALGAALLPAQRAATIDPMRVLREE